MIRTTIAKIISPTTVILAAGTLQGVTEGMEFIIYELTEPILDPETKEDLGQLELHKGHVRVINAEERASQAITFRKRIQHDPLWGHLTGSVWHDRELEELPIEPGAVTPPASELKVRVGDMVRSLN